MDKYIFYTFLFILSISIGKANPLPTIDDTDWELERDQNNIKVYTRSVTGSDIKEFKAETKVKATVDELLAILLDFDDYTNWVADCVTSEKLDKDGDTYRYYVEFGAPWPVTNRDVVTEATVTREPDGTVLFRMKGIPDYIEEKEDCKRMTTLTGLWQFTPAEDGWVEIHHQVHAEPGGSVPAWLANSRVTDGPLTTIENLKKIVAGE